MTTEIMTSKIAETPITNKKLKSYTEQIFKQGLSIKKSFARIAVILCKIDECKCYEQDGFESVQDYAEKVLGWKKANTYAMLRVGRDYIDGKTYESILPHGETDYSTSQLQALLPLKSVETAMKLAEEETISPDMTVKEIKEVVKVVTGKADNVEASEDDTQEETSEVVEAPVSNTLHTFQIMQDSNGAIFFMYDGTEVEKDAILSVLENF